MSTETISLDLADILRERIDQCAKFKRDAERPPKELLNAYVDGLKLSEDDTRRVESFFLASCLKLFLDWKEQLVIPDDAKGRGATLYVEDLGDLELTFAYQDFYAYQFVDRLDDIVRRAFKVRNVFAKHRPAPGVLSLCREAYQCYLNVFHTASIATIRSVVEMSLEDRLGNNLVGPGKYRALAEAGEKAGLYSARIARRVVDFFRRTNSLIHRASRGTGPTEHTNLELLGLAQEVLEALVSQEPPPALQQRRR